MCTRALFFIWFCATGWPRSKPKATTQVQVVLGEAVLRRGAVAGAIRGTAIADATLIRRTWLTRRECTSPTRTDCAHIHCFPVQSKSLEDMLCRRGCWSLLCMRSLDLL